MYGTCQGAFTVYNEFLQLIDTHSSGGSDVQVRVWSWQKPSKTLADREGWRSLIYTLTSASGAGRWTVCHLQLGLRRQLPENAAGGHS